MNKNEEKGKHPYKKEEKEEKSLKKGKRKMWKGKQGK